MNELYIDIGYSSLNKYGEQICGDHIDVMTGQNGDVIMVLADGLGSGIKAGILSTLTSKILATMLANNMEIEDCISTIAATLPVCSVRQIAYSTFSVIRIINEQMAEIIQYDNPHVILLRDGKNVDYPKSIMEVEGKTVYFSQVRIQEKDLFISVSDGAIHAGVGQSLNFGWQRENIIEFMENIYTIGHTAKTMSTILLNKCNSLYGGKPGDDTTVCVLRLRHREPVHLVIGPPENPADTGKMFDLFFSKAGKHIVCGGTTSTLAAQHLEKPLLPSLDYADKDIPPTAEIEGVDLVTEGVITINKVLTYALNYLADNDMYFMWSAGRDGASQIARLLFEEATDINFYVGRAVNPAHQNPSLPINFNIKMQLVGKLCDALSKMGKKIKVSYF